MTDSNPVPQQSEEPVFGRGRLPAEARRALVELMRQGVVMAETRRLVFEALCAHRNAITDHLADMYLRVQIDERAGLALLLQIEVEGSPDEDDEERPALIVRPMLTLYDTLLLIVLRKYFLDRETAGDQRIRIDFDQVESLLMPFLALSTSTASARKKLNGALETMKKRKILSSVRGEESRYEISPVIRYIVKADLLERLRQEYMRLAKEGGVSVSGDSEDEEDEDG